MNHWEGKFQRMRAYKAGQIPRSETEFSKSKGIGSIVKNEYSVISTTLY
jgi:hypothetical protein